jgi:magnesium chelatase subunit D
MRANFPFAALVGQTHLKEALLCVAVDPSIGGVLVSGTRGTAKSTAVRALADVLPWIDVVPGDPCNRAPAHQDVERTTIATPFVELPVGATEDRVIGTLDVRALLAGERRFEPGLLARANRGILYVDEVNLLPDHLVDVVLDAAATGVNVVERDGASFAHDARIVLVGTMNPEEGELRPQLLDRFGLAVDVESDDDLERRVAIVQARLAFDLDPTAFAARWAVETAELRERIVRARARLAAVSVASELVRRAAELAVAAGVEGMRADLTIVRTARALAALDARDAVVADDIDRAAVAALAHRRRERGPDAPAPRPPAAPPSNGASQPDGSASGSDRVPESRGDLAQPVAPQVFAIGAAALDAPPSTPRRHAGLALAAAARGHGARPTSGGAARPVALRTARIAVAATVRAAALAREPGATGALHIAADDVRFIERRARPRALVVFAVDASGSMAAQARMRAAKGVVCSLLAQAYRRRDAVALVAFRGDGAQTLVPPTHSAVLAYRRLRVLETGGRTPLGAGLAHAHALVAAYARREQVQDAHLILVTDARANAPARGALAHACDEAQRLRRRGVRALCVDTETGRIRLGGVALVARALGATYRHLDTCTERDLSATVREWMATA